MPANAHIGEVSDGNMEVQLRVREGRAVQAAEVSQVSGKGRIREGGVRLDLILREGERCRERTAGLGRENRQDCKFFRLLYTFPNS
jgi:hypothetical protein